jgi:hypothetical protein
MRPRVQNWGSVMTQVIPDELFRRAAEAENGMPISAGARISHVHMALQTGRAIEIDLSGVPDEQRPAVLIAIHELVNRARNGGSHEANGAP